GLAPVANLLRCWELHLSNDAAAELIGGTPEQFPERYRAADPVLRPAAVPRVLIHGTADDIVPVEMTRGFPSAARILELPGIDHFALIDPSSAIWPAVIREVTTLLES